MTRFWPVLLASFLAMMSLSAGSAHAAICCDPRTGYCLMVFDPRCDLPICSPYSPFDVTISDPADYVISCAATEYSFSISSGTVSIEGGGSLILK